MQQKGYERTQVRYACTMEHTAWTLRGIFVITRSDTLSFQHCDEVFSPEWEPHHSVRTYIFTQAHQYSASITPSFASTSIEPGLPACARANRTPALGLRQGYLVPLPLMLILHHQSVTSPRLVYKFVDPLEGHCLKLWEYKRAKIMSVGTVLVTG